MGFCYKYERFINKNQLVEFLNEHYIQPKRIIEIKQNGAESIGYIDLIYIEKTPFFRKKKSG